MLEAARSSQRADGRDRTESREQAAAIEEVNSAVRQLDEMTQHNAALVEETNAAIEQTESQATELDRIVDVFTTAEASKPRGAGGAGRKGHPGAAGEGEDRRQVLSQPRQCGGRQGLGRVLTGGRSPRLRGPDLTGIAAKSPDSA